MNVLIVEDEYLILKTLEVMTQRRGHSVTPAQSGREAIHLIKNSRYDLIICDLMLNDISGFDIIEEMKNLYGNAEIQQKVIIITAYKSEDIINRVKTYQCRFFEKPFLNIKETLDKMLEFH